MSNNVSAQQLSHLSMNTHNGSNSEMSVNYSSELQRLSQPLQSLQSSSRQAIFADAESSQLESVINNYHIIHTQLPKNSCNSWLQSFFKLMRSEWTRLRTFHARQSSKWTISFVTPEELANAAFFFLNEDRVQCAFCRGIVSGWERGDRPLAEHSRHFPRCPFIMEEDVGNIPIAEDPIRGPKRSIGHDVCGNYTPAMMSPVINSINTNSDESALAVDMREYGVQPHRGPKNPAFKSIDCRRRSFLNNCWDSTRIPVSVEQLSEAGFYSIGMSDYVKCFYCDGGLCNWESGDQPWVEHAKWFPDCQFVRLNKSVSFIDECKRLAELENNDNNGSNDSNYGSDREAMSINGSDSEEEPNDTLGMRAVNEWMSTDIVLQLIDLNAFSIDVIKAALHRKWREDKQPFASFEELYDAVFQCRSHFIVQNLPQRAPNVQISDDQSSGDDEYHSQSSTGSISSSQSSQSSTTSSISSTTSSLSSTLSSSPIESILESGYSDSSSKSDDNRLLCKICLDREIGVVFLPCGHQLACTQCAPCITDCPICRKLIRGTVRTFFS